MLLILWVKNIWGFCDRNRVAGGGLGDAGWMSLMIIELGRVEGIGGAGKMGLFGKNGVARAFVRRARRSADSSLRCASKSLERKGTGTASSAGR
jgi:hypothetical protein